MGKGRRTYYATIPVKLTQQPLFAKAFAVGDMIDLEFDVDAQTLTIVKKKKEVVEEGVNQ